MRKSSRFANLLTATVAAILAGCSSAGGTASGPVIPSGSDASAINRPETKGAGAAAFISDWDNHVIDIISRNGTVTTLHDYGPEGVAVDASHNLYAIDATGPDVLVYAPPYTGTPKVLTGAGVEPTGVAVDSNGNVAVTSLGSPSGGPGGVVFYAKGATAPTNTIPANSKFAGDFYCAFDAAGNLYLDSKNGSGPFEAGEVVGGIKGTSVKPLTTKNLVQYPGGMQVTESGYIAILDQGNGNGAPTIYAYNPPHGGSLGNPVKTTPLSNANDAVAFAFEGLHDGFVLTADTFYTLNVRKTARPDHQDQIGQTQVFRYPAGGGATKSVRLAYNAVIVGVAANPSETP
jgi:hypothetical protein